jgi:hypothetical protein
MSQPVSLSANRPGGAFKAILLAWIIAGTLDILAAIIHFMIKSGKSPDIIFKYISSAVFGKDAYAGGNTMIVYGVLFHYLVAFLFTVFFFFIYPYLRGLIRNTVITGLLFGVFVWLVMNLVVVPASLINKQPFTAEGVITGMLILMCCIGLPLALVIHRYYSKIK